MDKYFAASNSAQGFLSYYNECFSPCDKIYIIKGGPGTGKSSLMKRVAKDAEERFYYVEYFYCSSDPESLDGIIIYKGDKRIAILDGTAPHVYDTVYPGVRDNIINLGEAWDDGVLERSRERILELCRKKTHAYRRAYAVLGLCGNLSVVIDSYFDEVILHSKVSSAAEKLSWRYSACGKGTEEIRLIDSVSMKGRVRFDTLEAKAKETVVVGDIYGSGHIFLGKIREELNRRRSDIYISFDPIIPRRINGIFDKGSGVAYILADPRVEPKCENINYVNIKRFIGDGIRDFKKDLKYSYTLYKNSVELALKHLDTANKLHFELEDIYKGAMDFSIVDRKTVELVQKIL